MALKRRRPTQRVLTGRIPLPRKAPKVERPAKGPGAYKRRRTRWWLYEEE